MSISHHTYNQILGFGLILLIVVLNLIVFIVCINKSSCDSLFNTFSWGFTSAVVMCVGLLKLGGD